MCGRASVEALWRFHGSLDALAAAACSRDALVCIVEAEEEEVEGEAEEKDKEEREGTAEMAEESPPGREQLSSLQLSSLQLSSLLGEHGVCVACVVREGGEEAWAAERGVRSMGVLRDQARRIGRPRVTSGDLG